MTDRFQPPSNTSDLEASGFRRLRSRLFADMIVYTLVRAATGVGSLLLLIVLAHALAPADLGIFSLIVNAAALGAVAWYGWLGSASYRYSAAYRAAGRLSEMRALTIRAYTALAAALAVFLLLTRAVGIDEATNLSVGLFAAAVFLTISLGPAQSLIELYRVDGARVPYVQGALLLGIGPLAVVLIAAWATDVTVEVVLWSQAVIASGVFLVIALSWIGGGQPSRGEGRKELRKFLVFGIPFVGGLVCSWVLSVSDRYLIAALEGSHDVGTYTAGYQLATAPFGFIYAAAVAPVEPLSYSAHEGGRPERAGTILGKTFVLFLVVATLGLILVAIAREELVRLLLGTAYGRSADVMPLTALGSALMFLALMRQQVLILMHRTRLAFVNLLVAAVINVLLNLLLIPRIGILGAAVASAAAYGLLLVAAVVTTKGRYPFPLPPAWVRSWLAATVSCGALIGLTRLAMGPSTTRVLIEVVLGTIVYVTVLMVASRGEFIDFVKNLRGPAASSDVGS